MEQQRQRAGVASAAVLALLLALLWCGLSWGALLGFLAGVLITAASYDGSLIVQLLGSAMRIAVGRTAAALGMAAAAPPAASSTHGPASSSSGPFDLRHLLVNVDAELLPAWCNLGFWPAAAEKDAPACSYPQACSELVRRLASFAGVNSRSRILDCGSGCGEQDFWLVDHLDVEHIVAINIAPEQVQWARRRMQALDRVRAGKSGELQSRLLSGRIRFRVGSATEIPQLLTEEEQAEQSEDAPVVSSSSLSSSVPHPRPLSFTHVLAVDCAYHFAPSRASFLKQSFAVLEPGGCLALVDILPRFPSLPGGVEAQQHALPFLWRLGLRAVSSACGIPMANLHSLPAYRVALVAAGFPEANIEVQDISDHMAGGFARFVQQKLLSHKSATAPLSRSFTTAALLRFRVTAAALGWLAERDLIGCYLIRATKPR
jgi:SAM-dependent methyltransferase